jgi:hypothetical protein
MHHVDRMPLSRAPSLQNTRAWCWGAAAALACSALACTGAPEHATEGAKESEIVGGACAQVISQSDDEHRAILRDFVTKNGPGWTLGHVRWNYGNVLADISREDYLPDASATPVSEGDAKDAAKAFAERHWQLFGFHSEGAAQQVSVETYITPTASGYHYWSFDVKGPSECQDRYEGIDGSCQQIVGSIEVNVDGSPRKFHLDATAADRRTVPIATVATQPMVSTEKVVESLVGRHLTRVQSAWMLEPISIDYGPIAKDEITVEKVALYQRSDALGLNVALVYEVSVTKPAPAGTTSRPEGTFRIDACGGGIVAESVSGPLLP